MKKLLLTTMIASMLLIPFGTVAVAENQEASAAVVVETMTPKYVTGAVPAQSTMAQAISPAVHAMILAMNNHNVCQYSAENTDVAWESLYNLLSMCGQLDDRAEYVDGFLVFPAETVADFSCALLGYTVEPSQLPEFLLDRMNYDAQTDSYLLVCGNDDLSEIQFNDDTGDEMYGSLVYQVDGTALSSFCVVSDHADNLLGYRITRLELA